MSTTTWPNHKLTGLDIIDRQHQALIDAVDAFCSASSDQRHPARVREFLDAVLSLTREHFRCEEELMAECHYPRLGVHKVAHARLLAQITDVHRRAHLGEDLNFAAFLSFVKEWLVEHIDEEDVLMAGLIDRVGTRPPRV